jgi:hypothetical protein
MNECSGVLCWWIISWNEILCIADDRPSSQHTVSKVIKGNFVWCLLACVDCGQKKKKNANKLIELAVEVEVARHWQAGEEQRERK